MRASRNSWRAVGKAGEQEGGQKSRREGRRAGGRAGRGAGEQSIQPEEQGMKKEEAEQERRNEVGFDA